jgi:hypothetical protein
MILRTPYKHNTSRFEKVLLHLCPTVFEENMIFIMQYSLGAFRFNTIDILTI